MRSKIRKGGLQEPARDDRIGSFAALQAKFSSTAALGGKAVTRKPNFEGLRFECPRTSASLKSGHSFPQSQPDLSGAFRPEAVTDLGKCPYGWLRDRARQLTRRQISEYSIAKS